MRWRPRSVGMRLTLWHAATLTLVLVLYASGVYAFVSQSFYSELDRSVSDDIEVAEEMLERVDGDGLRWRGEEHGEGGETEPRWVAVWNREGRLLYKLWPFDEGSLEAPASDLSERIGPETITLPGGERVRQVIAPETIDGLAVVIRVARSEERLRSQMSKLLVVLLIGLPLAVGSLMARAPISRASDASTPSAVAWCGISTFSRRARIHSKTPS